MRVKITLLSPFAPSKFLLLVPDSVQTISQLKKHLRTSLSSISERTSAWREIKLEVDGFELLGGSQIGLVESGDVVSYVWSDVDTLSGIADGMKDGR